MICRFLVIVFMLFFPLTWAYAEKNSYGNAKKYDTGRESSIARQGNIVVEVHRSGYHTLAYKIGLIKDNKIEWGENHTYDTGTHPAISIEGNTVVEVHQSEFYDALWYHVGSLNAETKTITWGDAQAYDQGINPAVAISAGKAIAVHQLTERHLDFCYENQCYYYYTHKLYYRTGVIDHAAKMIDWSNDAMRYAKGMFPSLSVSGDIVVETHNAEEETTLWYKVGTLKEDRIDWKATRNYHHYDKGYQSSVSMAGNLLVEMHRSEAYNRLWYHIGTLDLNSKIITWGPSHIYDRGRSPSITLDDKKSLIEVHVSDFYNTLYHNLGQVNQEAKDITWKFKPEARENSETPK